MSGVAEDGADQLEQVMQKHSLGSTLPRKPSVGKGRVSHELGDEPVLPSAQERSKGRETTEGGEQVTN